MSVTNLSEEHENAPSPKTRKSKKKGAPIGKDSATRIADATPKKNSAASKPTNDEVGASPDIQRGRDEFRGSHSSDPGNIFSVFPRNGVTRKRRILPFGDGGPSSLVIPAKIAFTEAIPRNSREFHYITNEVEFLKPLCECRVGPDLVIADELAIPHGEERKRLAAHMCTSPNMPIFIGDPDSEFARRVPPAQVRHFPKTQTEVDIAVFQMFYGPPPVAALTLHFFPILEQLPDVTSPIEFIDRLEFTHREQYADALESLRRHDDARGILRWKLLDVLGELLLQMEIFHIRADLLPLGDHLNLPLVKTVAQQ